MNIFDFQRKKESHEKISMLTCYDYTSARIVANTAIDCILVGDSVAMTMHGFKDTIAATLDMMCMHTEAVHRGAPKKFIVSDLPFLSYRKSLKNSVEATERLMKAGANAIKLEGAIGNEKFIRHITDSGVPVMGHLGLTPQLIHILGGHKIQGKTIEAQEKLKKDALSLQNAGCFAVVLECVPRKIAKEITEALSIPTIGIGAGPDTNGQVLVFQDLLGMNIDFKPKFVKNFMKGFSNISESIDLYVSDLNSGDFPQNEHCYES
ncbi:MAG TPA: 3-methyl-2-oxobutanoate hydroxymethyltransferase [Gammaproteobacteria bacterium]|nr:3-methyl-2-oxobutanoate hydroxymethyltransferase [Gammaproteobacteria bacterium]